MGECLLLWGLERRSDKFRFFSFLVSLLSEKHGRGACQLEERRQHRGPFLKPSLSFSIVCQTWRNCQFGHGGLFVNPTDSLFSAKKNLHWKYFRASQRTHFGNSTWRHYPYIQCAKKIYPKLDMRISFVRPPPPPSRSYYPPLDSETGWTGELWSKTNLLNWQN